MRTAEKDMTTSTIPRLLEKLAEWGSEPHDSVCEGISLCRHDRAKQALVEVNNALAEMEKDRTRPGRAEAEFLDLYARVVAKAKECLAEANAKRVDPGDWPTGMKWEELVNTSKSIFMNRARDAMGIDHDWFLRTVREWPYTPAGSEKIAELFGE